MVQELKNEKIDFVDWNEDPTVYITNSLKPAKQIRRVELNEENMSAVVVVADEELSLAIGRRGQNARLVAKLTGWNIDIKSETEAPATLDNIFKNDSDDTPDDNEEDTTDEVTNPIEEENQTETDTNVEINSI